MFFSSPSTSFGLRMNDWSAGITTGSTKSGRVSRSRNCEMLFAPLISSSDFFCSAV